jgi:hypothetical protein
MAEPDPAVVLEDVLDRARAISAIANDDEHWQAKWDVLEELRPLGRVAFDRALRLLTGQFWDRALGCDMLSVLCNPDEEGWGHEAAVALVDSSIGQDDPELLWSLAMALGHAGAPVGAPVLARLTHHFDRRVRLAAVQGIVFCEGSGDERNAQPVSDVLLSLLEDEDDEIRDWATTGLARQLDDDSPVIRAALWNRMSDPAPGVRCEAIVGLARRHAPHIVERVREGLLDNPVDHRVLVAASFLADPELFPLLESIATRGLTSAALEAALAQCDPVLQGFRVEQMTRLLSALEQRLDASAQDYVTTMACPLTGCIENDVDLMVSQHGEHLAAWNVPTLLEFRCKGDIEAAADEVVADLQRRRERTL